MVFLAGIQCARRRRPVPMQRCNDAGSVLGAPDGAGSRLPAHAPPSDPRCWGASQRTLRQIMQSPGAPSQVQRYRAAPPCTQAMSGTGVEGERQAGVHRPAARPRDPVADFVAWPAAPQAQGLKDASDDCRILDQCDDAHLPLHLEHSRGREFKRWFPAEKRRSDAG